MKIGTHISPPPIPTSVPNVPTKSPSMRNNRISMPIKISPKDQNILLIIT